MCRALSVRQKKLVVPCEGMSHKIQLDKAACWGLGETVPLCGFIRYIMGVVDNKFTDFQKGGSEKLFHNRIYD